MKTIYMVRGTMCAGKTSLLGALQRGDRHLVDSPTLAPLFDNDWAYLDVGPITDCWQQGTPMLPVIEEAFGDRDIMLAEPCYCPAQMFREATEGRFNLIHVYLFAPPWMVDTRRKLRFTQVGVATPDTIEQYEPYAKWRGNLPAENEIAWALAAFPTAQLVWLDTRDYPLHEVGLSEVEAMVRGEPTAPELPDVSAQYQQCLHIGGEWYGSKGLERMAFEQARLDAILPDAMPGWTVLDIGASDGGFCYEALNRGAYYCTAVEVRTDRLALLRGIRDRCHLPVCVADLDINEHPIPPTHSAGQHCRYDLGLLLNVLHHTPDSEAVLGKVMDSCQRIVVETPALGDCDEPWTPGIEPYPNYKHLPRPWVEKVAARHGFRLTEARTSPYQGDFRSIFKLEWESGG